MTALPRVICVLALVAGLLAPARAQSSLPPQRVALDSLKEFRPTSANWQLASAITGDPRNEKTLTGTEGTGLLVNSPTPAARGHLFTAWEHGDLELDFDFLLPVGSNSGIYLQGRYEIQLFDSWGVKEPKYSDSGGIYQRWDPARGAGEQGYEGRAPAANSSRAPGLWQHLHVEFEAPRFDASGQKTKNARFVRVVLNGFVIHENAEVTGPTRSPAFPDEKPLGPIMIQGDHGPIALRAITFKRGNPEQVRATNLTYRLHPGEYRRIGEYDTAASLAPAPTDRLSTEVAAKSGKFGLVYTGSLVIPRDGHYAFSVDSSGPARLQINGRTTVVPLERTSQPGQLALTAGEHPFRLDVIHNGSGRPRLNVQAEGPGIARHSLTPRESDTTEPATPRSRQLLVEAKDRTLVQRGFVPFEPRKQLYAASVGSPSGVHFAYDFETGALLRAWRGLFLDTFEMWDGRGNNQLAKPAGPALTFSDRPLVALLEFAQNGDWPTQPEPLWTSHGYALESDGQPVFLSRLSEIAIRDRIAPLPDNRGLSRQLSFQGRLPDWSAWVLLADAESITPQPGGRGWIVGDREWYLYWPADATQPTVVRTRNNRTQLAVPLTSITLETPISYEIVW